MKRRGAEPDNGGLIKCPWQFISVAVAITGAVFMMLAAGCSTPQNIRAECGHWSMSQFDRIQTLVSERSPEAEITRVVSYFLPPSLDPQFAQLAVAEVSVGGANPLTAVFAVKQSTDHRPADVTEPLPIGPLTRVPVEAILPINDAACAVLGEGEYCLTAPAAVAVRTRILASGLAELALNCLP